MHSQKIIDHPRRPKPAPIEYAGQWVAWNPERTEIIAHARTFAEVHNAATAASQPNAIFQRVRRLNETIVGRL
ncbi:MAG TPA: DUF5678 domain-containing protein [Planctomycetaceae bacterium]